MFDTAIGGARICSATQAAELPPNARQDQPAWVARSAGSVAARSAAEEACVYRTAATTAPPPERHTTPTSVKPAPANAAMCQSAGGENSSVG